MLCEPRLEMVCKACSNVLVAETIEIKNYHVVSKWSSFPIESISNLMVVMTDMMVVFFETIEFIRHLISVVSSNGS